MKKKEKNAETQPKKKAGEKRAVRVTRRERKRKNERKRDREGEVKWSRAIREIEGMKVRDGEHKIMEGGREIEKGTLGSGSKSV